MDERQIEDINESEETQKPTPEEPIYRGGTLDALSAMLSMAESGLTAEEAMAQIEKDEEQQSLVLYIPEDGGKGDSYLRYCLPSDLERSNSILLEPLAEGLKKGELAKDYYHIEPNQLSMLIRPGYKNKVNRNIVLCALLIPRKPVSLDKANHILMELGHPGLYDKTGTYRENIRNRMLMNIFEYAQENECPRDRWLFLANDILRKMDLKPLFREKNPRSIVLSQEEEQLLEVWKASAQAVCSTDGYMEFRRDCFDRYCGWRGLSITAAQNRISQKALIGIDSVKNILCASEMSAKTRSSRPTLMWMAIELGCDLDEGNRILMETGFPLLYPFRENDEDRFWIYALLRNGLERRE